MDASNRPSLGRHRAAVIPPTSPAICSNYAPGSRKVISATFTAKLIDPPALARALVR
jgi:hypothetical protein